MQRSADAYAKLNLTLDILGKRGDGYHLLKMIMQSISLHDTVTVKIENTGQITIHCNQDDIPCDERNTVHKAARAFFEATGIQQEGLSVKIKKRIPHGAGLGGGSADAAAVIRVLDDLYETRLSVPALIDIGEKVGADVPFCLVGGTTLAEGTGNILSPLPDLEEGYFVLVKPEIHSSTAMAYAKWDETQPSSRPNAEAAVDAVFEHSLEALGAHLFNVFEEVLQLPEVTQIKEIMHSEGAFGACLSGSGSTVFGLFGEKSDAEDCRKRLEEDYAQVFVCRPVPEGVILT